MDGDCLGQSPHCVTTSNGVTFPGGSCSSSCDAKKSDPATGRNPDCPGTNSVCLSSRGVCARSCTEKTGANPCRTGYSCFNDEFDVCGPDGISQCDPQTKGSCASTDAGARACVRVGLDQVGKCVQTCDLFAQDCAQAGYACFPNAVGEGTCLVVTAQGGDGAPCTYKNDCKAGFGCGATVCRPFCGGPNSVACTNGKACIDYDTGVPKSVAGLCDG